jgi:hypothetical protein
MNTWKSISLKLCADKLLALVPKFPDLKAGMTRKNFLINEPTTVLLIAHEEELWQEYEALESLLDAVQKNGELSHSLSSRITSLELALDFLNNLTVCLAQKSKPVPKTAKANGAEGESPDPSNMNMGTKSSNEINSIG